MHCSERVAVDRRIGTDCAALREVSSGGRYIDGVEPFAFLIWVDGSVRPV